MEQERTAVFENMETQRQCFLGMVRNLADESSSGKTQKLSSRFLEAVSMGDIFVYPHRLAIIPRCFRIPSRKVVFLIPDDFAKYSDHFGDEKLLSLIEESIMLYSG